MKRYRLFIALLCLLNGWSHGGTGAYAQGGGHTLEPAPDGSFSIVVIPDTQRYMSQGERADADTEGEITNSVFDAHTRWIVDNLEAQKIVFVSHVGDIVDINNHNPWRVARRAMDRLHGRVPYGISVGNHDMESDGNSALFREYFPAFRFEAFDWYGGTFPGDPERPHHSGNNANSYQLISSEGIDLLMLHLECNAPDIVLDWAEGIVAEHPDRLLIVTTHMDLGPLKRPSSNEGFFIDPKGRMTWTKRHGERGNSPRQLWDKFYKKQKNLLLIFSGDQSRTTAMYMKNTGDHGNTVHALMSDYTSSGPLRIYRFHPEENQIRVITYDTSLNRLVEDTEIVPGVENHQFTIEYEFVKAPVSAE